MAVSGSTSLALALAAGPSRAGSWCAIVGAPALGLSAAAEMGVALERFPVIAPTGRSWARAAAAALEAFDVILAWPAAGFAGHGVTAAEARRLAALGREQGAVLVVCGQGWPERVDLRLDVVSCRWLGLGLGHGRLRARRMEVAVAGRGVASAVRRGALWLPGFDGRVALSEPDEHVPEAVPGIAMIATAG
jgi:hypothetical protein